MAEPVHDGQEFLDDPADFGVLRRREIVEKLHKFADEAERSRHELAGIGEGDFLSLGIQFREKEAIGEHLRESVGKFAEPEFVEDLIAENLVEAIKAAFPVLFFLALQFVVEKVVQKLAAGGESERQLLRAADALRRGGEEAAQ